MALYLHSWIILIYRCLISLFGIPGNLLIVAVYWNKQTLGSAQVFIQALALSDLYVCLLLPLDIHYWLHEYEYENINLCRTYITAASIGGFLSIFITIAIALDRYIAVANPVNGRWSRRKAQKVAAVCVFLSISINLAVPFSSSLGVRELPGVVNGTQCIKQNGGPPVLSFMVLIPQYLTCLLAFILVFFIYFKLWRTVNKHNKKIGVQLENDGISIVGGNKSIEITLSSEHTATHARDPAGQWVDSNNVITAAQENCPRNGSAAKSGTTTNMKSDCSVPETGESKAGEIKNRCLKRKPPMSRLTLMLLLTTVIFFITWVITLVAFSMSPLMRRLNGNSLMYAIIHLFRYCNLINNAINPFLYSLLNPRFRADCGLLYKRLKATF